jgi:hypothetical protein
MQLCLGFLTTILLFYVTWKISSRSWLAGLIALAHTLNPQQIFFEADLLTETLATFLILLALVFLLGLFLDNKLSSWKLIGLALLAGTVSGMAALTRPLFIFLPFLMAFFALFFWRAKPGVRWSVALAVGLSGAAVLGVWVNYIYQTNHFLSLTTMGGYHLVQHTGVFFEYVPDEYATIRDIYLQYRADRVAATGSQGNTIWAAIPALQEATGLTFNDLSRAFSKISIQLILAHPDLYLKNVILGWIWFWKVPVYWMADSFRFSWLGGVVKWIILGWRGALVLINLAFVSGSLTLVWKRVRRIFRMDLFQWFLFGMLWVTSVVQTLLDHGDNPRFLVPVQSLLVLLVVAWGTQLILFLRKKDEKTPS